MKVLSRFVKMIVVLVISFTVTGCWDSTELNDRALVLATGMDLTETGQLLITAQIIVPVSPASKGSKKDNFTSISATGRTLVDALQELQSKLSRKYFLGHRRVIFVGESIAKHGLEDLVDEFTRNPDVRLRSDIYVVKDSTAASALRISTILESHPALAIVKSRQFVGGYPGTALLDFMMGATSPMSYPTMPLVEITRDIGESNQESLIFSGRAIFNKKLKLVGYLNYPDASYRLWMLNKLQARQVTFDVPKTHNLATIDLSKMKGRIRPVFHNRNVQFEVTLTGNGLLRESAANLNLQKPEQLNMLNRGAEKEIETNVSDLISRVQKDYGTDIFGFNMTLSRKYPKQWRKMGSQWDAIFPHVAVKVIAHISIQSVGLTFEK